MKNRLLLIFSLLLSIIQAGYAQSISSLNGYKFVALPPLTYQDGSTDIYSISANVRDKLLEAGFYLILDPSNPNNFPQEAKENPCTILTCFIEHPASSNVSNSVTISFVNCYSTIVYKAKGVGGMGWDISGDFRIATRKAMKEFDAFKLQFDSKLTPEIKYPEVEKLDETEATFREYLGKSKVDPIEGIYKSYQDNNMGYYRLGIKKRDYQYIAVILESDNKVWKQGEIKAYIEPSSVKGIYSVQWLMSDKTKSETFAEIEDNIILSVEFKDDKTGEKQSSKFIKLYPQSDKQLSKSEEGSKTSGSGFFLTTNGLIATNAHVINGAKKIEVKVTNEFGTIKYNAKLALKDVNNDVAILKIDDPKFKELSNIPYSLVSKSEIGEKVFTIGFPLNGIMGTNFKVTDGIVSSNTGSEDDVRFYQISVPLQPGNSGGPLFNKDGNIVGLTTAKLNPEAVGTNVENVNYAIKIQYLATMLNLLPSYIAPSPDFKAKGKELAEQIKILKNYVCLIEVTQ